MVCVVAPTWSVAVMVKVSVPVAVGVPVMVMALVPLPGRVKPAMAFWTLLTTRLLLPVPPEAVMVWL